MKIYKITEASEYIGVSINSLKTLANNGKIKSFSTTGKHRRFRQEDLDSYMGVEKVKQEKLIPVIMRVGNRDVEVIWGIAIRWCEEEIPSVESDGI